MSPNLRHALDDVGSAVAHALETDPALLEAARQLLAIAQAAATVNAVDEGSGQALDSAVAAVVTGFQCDPEIGRIGLADASIAHFVWAWLVKVTTGEALPPPREVRVRALPGIPAETVWTLLTDADIATLRAKLAPGQTWVLMNDVDYKVWPRVSALVQFQRRALGEFFGRPGRPAGSRSAARRALIDHIRAADASGQPLSNDAIASEARETGVWPTGVADDYDGIRKRIATLRRAAKQE